ncbi:MAG: HAMP domain-containing protein [Novosphingobium sp.]|nr:MAG: HAMP domain-containing protein [Novosphingobium sp.]
MVSGQSIKRKVTIGCLILGAGALASTALSMGGMWRQELAVAELNAATGLLRDHMEADMGHDAIRGEVVSIVAARQTAAIDGAEAARDLKARLGEFENRMAPTARATDAPQVLAARKAADPAFRDYVAIGRSIAAAAEQGVVPDDAELQRFQQLFSQLEGEMAKISDAVEAHAAQTVSAADAVAQQARLISLASLLLLLLALAWVARYARRDLVTAIIAISERVQAMAAGRLDVTMAGEDRPDEIGDLARAVVELRDNLSEARADTARQAEAIVASIGTGLSELAAGNLAYRIDVPLSGPFEKLRRDFNGALGELGSALAKMQASTERLHGVARDIGGAAGDLSNRNANQAASLEETAAAIASLSRRVQGSTEAVSTARTAVDQVGQEINRGGEVIQHAEAAMDRIESAAQEIGSIVSVIDGITFQTNLLALNAGVEAARAGDAGKGFAVVANEVRALAQRSADAAREIRDLITNASGEIGNGVTLVRDAGSSLRAITGQMDEINRVMEVVEAGASEQDLSLRSIDATSKQIEQITQSNSAVAEQVSDASHRVIASIEEVVQQLSRFEIGHGSYAAAVGATRALAA